MTTTSPATPSAVQRRALIEAWITRWEPVALAQTACHPLPLPLLAHLRASLPDPDECELLDYQEANGMSAKPKDALLFAIRSMNSDALDRAWDTAVACGMEVPE